MPNHITNILTIQADEDKVREILESIKSDENGLGSIDFNKLIPMPESLNIEAGSRSSHGLEIYKAFLQDSAAIAYADVQNAEPSPYHSEAVTALLKKYQDLTKDDPELLQLGRQCYENIQNYGCTDWYECYLKLLRYSYSSGCKSFAAQPFDISKLFDLIQQLETRMATVVVENQDFETLIRHYDRPDTFFYLDPPYFSTEDMYDVEFGWDDHVRLRDTLAAIEGKFLLSYNDCPEIRGLYKGFNFFDFKRSHSMAQRYEAGKEFPELLIGNYDLYERQRAKPAQLTLFSEQSDDFDYEKILKECIISCKEITI